MKNKPRVDARYSSSFEAELNPSRWNSILIACPQCQGGFGQNELKINRVKPFPWRRFFDGLTSDWKRSPSGTGCEPTKATHIALAKRTMSFMFSRMVYLKEKYDIVNKIFSVGSCRLKKRSLASVFLSFFYSFFWFRLITLMYLPCSVMRNTCFSSDDSTARKRFERILRKMEKKVKESRWCSKERGELSFLELGSKLSLSTEWKWRTLPSSTQRFPRNDCLTAGDSEIKFTNLIIVRFASNQISTSVA